MLERCYAAPLANKRRVRIAHADTGFVSRECERGLRKGSGLVFWCDMKVALIVKDLTILLTLLGEPILECTRMDRSL